MTTALTVTTPPARDGISVQHMVTLAAVGLFGFLASDFVTQRDGRTDQLERRLREIIDTSGAATTAALTDLKSEVRDQSRSNGAALDALERRLNATEANNAALSREMDITSDRIERLTSMIRERTLDRIEGENQ